MLLLTASACQASTRSSMSQPVHVTAGHAHVPGCRGSLLPDPRYDVVRCIALAAANDVEDVAGGRFAARALLFDAPGAPPSRLGMPDVQARCVSAARAHFRLESLGYRV